MGRITKTIALAAVFFMLGMFVFGAALTGGLLIKGMADAGPFVPVYDAEMELMEPAPSE